MKLKNVLCMLLFLALITTTPGCGNAGGTNGRSADKQTGVEDVLQTGMAEADEKANADAPEPAFEANAGAVLSSTEGIDVDLTSLSSTMVYSEVYNMMYEPEKYVGKTIKMEGLFAAYHDESTGNYYFACTIQDATACCAQGIEFVLTDDYSYPGDYPDEGDMITVIGIFDTYMEGDYMYCTLRDAILV